MGNVSNRKPFNNRSEEPTFYWIRSSERFNLLNVRVIGTQTEPMRSEHGAGAGDNGAVGAAAAGHRGASGRPAGAAGLPAAVRSRAAGHRADRPLHGRQRQRALPGPREALRRAFSLHVEAVRVARVAAGRGRAAGAGVAAAAAGHGAAGRGGDRAAVARAPAAAAPAPASPLQRRVAAAAHARDVIHLLQRLYRRRTRLEQERRGQGGDGAREQR